MYMDFRKTHFTSSAYYKLLLLYAKKNVYETNFSILVLNTCNIFFCTSIFKSF